MEHFHNALFKKDQSNSESLPILKRLTWKIKLETRLTGKLKNLQLVPGLRQGKLKGKKMYSCYYQFHHILLMKISP